MNSLLQIQLPHPVFAEQVAGSLHVASENIATLLQHQQFMLRREPNNLRRHVQYIFALLAEETTSRDALFGALLDLFIVLGDKGLPLRRRMLSAAKSSLPEQDVDWLNLHLLGGLSANTVVTKAGFSVLTQSYRGKNTIISKAEQSAVQPELSFYEQAVSLLEYGDIDQAAELLVLALQQQPSDQQIADELLAIYQHQRNDQALEEVRHWFIENDLPLPNNWPLL